MITAGKARAVVVGTGPNTAIGKIRCACVSLHTTTAKGPGIAPAFHGKGRPELALTCMLTSFWY